MTVHIALGWWLLPAAITLLSFGWAIPLRADEQSTGGMFDGLRFIPCLFRQAGAAIISLAAWLVWALLR